MEVTDIRIRGVKAGKMRAVVSVTFDDVFVVHDIKVIEGRDGECFVSMPSRLRPNGTYQDIAHPITAECRETVREEVLTAYAEWCEAEAASETL